VIQVCSQCGTRWNVRDRQRVGCPRCRGALLAPSMDSPGADPRWGPGAVAQSPVQSRTPPRLPPGYRWIAVRPGAPPLPRRRRRPLGPTPRYTVIPRWGLVDHIDADTATQIPAMRRAPSAAQVRAAFFVSVVTLGAAALVHVLRYVLLVINRNTLLNSLVAVAAVGLSVLASLAAIAAAITCAVMLTRWLIARRAAAFAHCGQPDPRPTWALWIGCLLPPSIAIVLAIVVAVILANLGHPASWALMAGCVALCCLPLLAMVWVLVYVVELAKTEDLYNRLRKSVWRWWLLWLLSAVTSIFATVTGAAQDAQGIANNTVAMVVAYLLALVAVMTTASLFEGFERKPIERPSHRWVIVADDGSTDPATMRAGRPEEELGNRAVPGSAPAVELEGAEPAA
jgi:hypothetical protein